MEEQGIRFRAGHMGDQFYDLPSKTWFYKTFPKALKKFYKKNGLIKYNWKERRYKWRYTTDTNDCENAALGALFLASALNFRNKGKLQKAVGEFWYTREVGGPHAINCAYLDTRELVFMEPQQLKIVKLTDKELKSCYFYRF